MAKKKKMTAKQRTFVDEYLVDLNATQAAIRAGYAPKTAGVIGCENLKKLNIAAAIQKRMDARSERTGIKVDRVLIELGRIAFFDARELFDDAGNQANLSGLPADTAAAIANIDINSYLTESGDLSTTTKFRILDKLRALELVGRHLRMFTDKFEVNENLALSQIVKEIQGQEKAGILPPGED